ncbi:DUF4174 domain-containing protein [Stenomitos frigidus]|uniref:DUF4174 domain-containing protein n=1 Tax=Stenomitos frigidus ULC18 TaxID=2107698 RepID=A0A2T1ER83_9CYAN|nr:DUF4174 domain-containing protein [Stenomitos frigidus]PSB35249.1 hypothetical protein C7B82_01225 [Stenomitos frigidus ULC18]
MQPLFILALFLPLLQACTNAHFPDWLQPSPKASVPAPQPEALNLAATPSPSEMSFNLRDQQWQHRIVLLFAPSERSPAYQQQMEQWQAHQAGMQERDLKLVEVLGEGESRADGQPITPAATARLRQQFGLTSASFAVILIGKDGTEKQRERAPIAPSTLFRTIDAMPMRQQEQRSQP